MSNHYYAHLNLILSHCVSCKEKHVKPRVKQQDSWQPRFAEVLSLGDS